ncbi:hypothetical protein PUMCH_000410 [Australozyma saopauloensis]|uniref:Transcription factor BYE1 n=1 Tax=Australozyma saopauloensis TaxID=291208 RepID=A0AAX4H408_9ASCO|nr:hypothetical protein PUMCH_000410 [[Candida] saopauloensis]
MEEPRRSARANKGVHSGRDLLDVYYVNLADEPAHKRIKVDESNDQDSIFEIPAPSEVVKCLPCGTTDANYNEETDQGGLMIECERCTTWQHAKCMGYKSERAIPKVYLCNVCKDKDDPTFETSKSIQGITTPDSTTAPSLIKTTSAKPKVHSAAAAKKAAVVAAAQKTRDSVSKALLNVIVKCNSELNDAHDWSVKIENAIFEWAQCTDKKYIEKSRAIMALVKKPIVLNRLINGEISATQLTTLPVEEIDPDLKHYAEKVRQELIRRSVLVVEDDQSQRVRRTHKGEEIVESAKDEVDDHTVSVVAKNVSLKKSAEMQESSRKKIIPGNSSQTSYHYEDDDDYSTPATVQDSKSESNNADASDSEDDMDLILERKSKSPEPKATDSIQIPKKPKLPPTIPTKFWSGEVELPDVASAIMSAEFISCSKYEEPKDNITVSFHNKAMRICKELIENSKILIQGRLDRSRADPYVDKIRSSRDLFIVKLTSKSTESNFDKLYQYFLKRSKVGVISCRASFVKDAYLYALSGTPPPFFESATLSGDGLYIVYVVKKDYVPVGKSILKKPTTPHAAKKAPPSLDSILSKLGGPTTNQAPVSQLPGHLPAKPVISAHPLAPASSMPHGQYQAGPQQATSGLTQEQLMFLTDLVSQNGQNNNNQPAMLTSLHNNH